MENFIYINDRIKFYQRVKVLRLPDYEEKELPLMPTWILGYFDPWQVEEFLELWRQFPEFHIITWFGPHLVINGFIKNGNGYLLGEGEANPNLIHDPFLEADADFLHSRNSGRSKFLPQN